MTKSDKNGQIAELSVEQHSAIALLLTGLTDAEVAAKIGRQRSTICYWKRYNPKFQAQLNQECRSLWGAYTAKMRGLLPLALEVAEQELRGGEQRVRVALELLKLASLPLSPTELTDEEEIIQAEVEKREKVRMSPLMMLGSADAIRREILAAAREDGEART